VIAASPIYHRRLMRKFVVVSGTLAALAGTAHARPASTGWFAEGGLGAVAFLTKASKDAKPGLAIDLRLGRDLFSWLSVGISLAASSHEATVPPPPNGEWFQLYRGGADARVTLSFERIAVFAEGGLGLAMISSNILEKVRITDPGERRTVAFEAGAGLQYQLENRHYAVGVGADGFVLPQFRSIKGIDARIYLRYTY